MNITFEVPGNPIALKRHRHTKAGFSYDPSKSDKADFLAMCMNNRPKKPFEGALSVKLEFFFVRPKSHYGMGKNAGRIKESAPQEHITKPDVDNLIKFVLDSLNGIFYKDDRQVVNLLAFKTYTDNYPCVSISIMEL